MTPPARIEARALSIGAALVVLALCARALVRPDPEWDAWAYHLPFAARLWDIVPRSSFELDQHLELLFRAYPVAMEWLQGLLWRLTGHLQSSNLVALGSLLLFIELLKRRFGVSRPRSVFALLAIPMVQIHATSAYVDLPANVAAASAVLLSYRAVTAQQAEPSELSLAAACAALAAGSKFQMLPIAGLSLAVILFVSLRQNTARTPTRLGILLLALAFAAYPYVRNTLTLGMPFYPVSVSGLWSHGPLLDYEGPRELAKLPGAVRWLASLLGRGELDPSRGYFSVDATSGTAGGRTYQMGGYFAPWVWCQLPFVWRLNRGGSRAALGALGVFALLTVLVAVSPQAHQLRYYSYWILVVVALNLARAETLREGAAFGGRFYTRLSVLAFASVLLLTRARFLDPGSAQRPLARFLEERTPIEVLARLRPGGNYCLVGEPYPPFAFSSEFVRSQPYSLKSSYFAKNCGAREIVPLTPGAELRR